MALLYDFLSGHTHLSSDQVTQLVEHLPVRKFRKKERILSEGEICRESIFVQKGLLRSYSIDQQGKEHIIQFAPENWLISDRSSIYFNEGAMFFIDAIEDTEGIMLPHHFFREAVEKYPSLAEFNEQLLQKHIRSLQFRINQLLGATAEERYLSFIELYPDLLLRVPQWMIASYLGITPESLSRVRKELAKRHHQH